MKGMENVKYIAPIFCWKLFTVGSESDIIENESSALRNFARTKLRIVELIMHYATKAQYIPHVPWRHYKRAD